MEENSTAASLAGSNATNGVKVQKIKTEEQCRAEYAIPAGNSRSDKTKRSLEIPKSRKTIVQFDEVKKHKLHE